VPDVMGEQRAAWDVGENQLPRAAVEFRKGRRRLAALGEMRDEERLKLSGLFGAHLVMPNEGEIE